jgi:hypothetical protein
MDNFAAKNKKVEELSHQITADGAEVFHADDFFQNFLEAQTKAFCETEDALVKTLVSMLFVPEVRDEVGEESSSTLFAQYHTTWHSHALITDNTSLRKAVADVPRARAKSIQRARG